MDRNEIREVRIVKRGKLSNLDMLESPVADGVTPVPLQTQFTSYTF